MIMARVLKSMDPFGLTLLDYFKGDTSAKIIIQRDDGFKDELPISLFFRDPSDFPPLEQTALDLCRSRILDILL